MINKKTEPMNNKKAPMNFFLIAFITMKIQ